MFWKLICYFAGHHFKPMCEMQKNRVRYTCDDCGWQTGWMTSKQEQGFNALYCPTWGGRGSDSQGYRNQPQEAAR